MLKKLFSLFFIMPHIAMENIGFYGHFTSNTMSAGLSQEKGAQLVKAMENQKKYANKTSQLSVDGQIIPYHHCNYVEKNPLLDQQYFYMEKSDGIILLVGNHYQLESIWLLDNDNQTINGQFNRQNQREFCFFLNKLTWESKQCLMIHDKDHISSLLFFPVVHWEPVDLYLKNNFYCKTLLDQYLEDQYYKLVNDNFIEYYETNEFNSQLDFNIVNAIKSRLLSYSTDIACLCLVFILYWASTFFKFNELNYLSILFFFN